MNSAKYIYDKFCPHQYKSSESILARKHFQ